MATTRGLRCKTTEIAREGERFLHFKDANEDPDVFQISPSKSRSERFKQVLHGADKDSDAFEVLNSQISLRSLERWKQAILVLNRARRFRYTAVDNRKKHGNTNFNDLPEQRRGKNTGTSQRTFTNVYTKDIRRPFHQVETIQSAGFMASEQIISEGSNEIGRNIETDEVVILIDGGPAIAGSASKANFLEESKIADLSNITLGMESEHRMAVSDGIAAVNDAPTSTYKSRCELNSLSESRVADQPEMTSGMLGESRIVASHGVSAVNNSPLSSYESRCELNSLEESRLADLHEITSRSVRAPGMVASHDATAVDDAPASIDETRCKLNSLEESRVVEDLPGIVASHDAAAVDDAPGFNIGLDIEAGQCAEGGVNWEFSFGGRMLIPSTYNNIKRFILLQPTMNAAALIIDIVAMVTLGLSPLTPFQLLWVKLIMDTLGALEPLAPQGDAFQRSSLVSNVKTRNLVLQVVFQIGVLLTILFRSKELLRMLGHDPTVSDQQIINTIIFNAFVLCQLFDAVNARQPARLNIFAGLLQNGRFLGILGTTLILQVAMLEFLHSFTSTVKLSWKDWVACTVIGFLSWPVALVGKFIPVPAESWLRFFFAATTGVAQE